MEASFNNGTSAKSSMSKIEELKQRNHGASQVYGKANRRDFGRARGREARRKQQNKYRKPRLIPVATKPARGLHNDYRSNQSKRNPGDVLQAG